MGKNIIFDISHHQISSELDWKQAAMETAFCVIRVQYGSSVIDKEYKNHVANCKKYGIPFGHYAYGHFVSVADAKKEAQDFLSRIDKDAKFLVLDTEGDTIDSCGTKNIAEASQAFIDVCKQAGYKTGFYVSHNLYPLYGLDKVNSDFLWIPRYGDSPKYPCCLWQYTESGKVEWFGGTLDLNQINGDKDLDWFIGVEKKTNPKPITHKVIVPNTSLKQASTLVAEYEKKGFKCYGHALKTYTSSQKAQPNDPYWFVIETDYETAKSLVIELKTRGYDRTYGTKIK
jgi:GH25 family lysozyme M1 (1,4-beta-N-acetylmuramidase)